MADFPTWLRVVLGIFLGCLGLSVLAVALSVAVSTVMDMIHTIRER